MRVTLNGELEGLDLHEHGTVAYHVEFGQGMTYSTPANLPLKLPANGGKEPVSSLDVKATGAGEPGSTSETATEETPV